ncbi:ABC-type Fe3+-hydroxamate transport system, periplasmic component [Methanocella conradii HZ254]|uniref:ABC-type Fe3+-hydroxamate transport system, periplasmic component n=1 Tax=Methanocella conradii (strain DSM 24694 / JCM 17849 / CGMCC 1.5162 / HZ254) TaxID=1041930 RepID=H8I8X7_METCZ|nr:ABC transporter substrate-binding protein [Methanocella conradii]AFD00448.1 ABC-type Fe3+-hydroxamate transport system, periplasmic component [Methanocella conradii HZ254]
MYAKRLIVIALILILMTSIVAGCTQLSKVSTVNGHDNAKPVKFIDSRGNEVTLPKHAERIISTNAGCTEMLVAIGAKDNIVGVTDYVAKNRIFMNNLPANVTNIGSFQTPDIEKIISLNPDVVICYADQSQQGLNKLIEANISIVYLDCYKLDNLSSDARALGVITGKDNKAEEYAQFIDKYLGLVKNRTKNLEDAKKPAVYWESYYAYSTAGKDSSGDFKVRYAGGRNLAGDNMTSSPKVNNEWVVKSNPDVIIKQFTSSSVKTPDDAKKIYDEMCGRTGMSDVNAVKNKKVYLISDNMNGGRNVISLLYIAKIIQPQLFSDIDPDKVHEEYARKFLPGANEGMFIYP